MPIQPTTHRVQHFDTLVSPLESKEEPTWLRRATPEQRRLLQEHHKAGRQARALAMQDFADIQSLYEYTETALDQLDRNDFTPEVFLHAHQRLGLSKNYKDYLQPLLSASALRTAKLNAYLATLREESTIATIKGYLAKDGQTIIKWILDAFEAGSPEFTQHGPFIGATPITCSSVRLLKDVELADMILFGPDLDESPCVAYVPGHPRHPLKQYASRTGFFTELRRQLLDSKFQHFLQRFIPFEQQQRIFAAWRDQEQLFDLSISSVALTQGLAPYVHANMVKRLLDDATYLVPIDTAHAQRLDFLEANFATTIEEHLMIGAGPGVSSGEEDEGLPPSEWIAPLHWVSEPDGAIRRWRADLSNFTLGSPTSPVEPDAQGIHHFNNYQAIRINQELYRVQETAGGSWRIAHPKDPKAFGPALHHNGCGAWHHSLEQPARWSRLSLLRRLGPLVEGFSDDRLLMLGRMSGVSNARLRRVYLLDRPAPALLRYVIARARAYDEAAYAINLIRQGQALPEGFDTPVVQAFQRLVVQALGLPSPHRVRRDSDDESPPEQCEASCTAPPAELLGSWTSRLLNSIFIHRFELSQVPPDLTVHTLRQHYPDLPLHVAQEMLENNVRCVAEQLRLDHSALEFTEQVLAVQQQARLAQALEGFSTPWADNQDARILAFRLLEFLPGWQAGTPLLLRSENRFGSPLARLGTVDVDTPTVYQDREEGWFASGIDEVLHAHDLSEYGFYRSLLAVMSDTQRQSLGLGLNEAERLYQNLRELATTRPLRSALLLDLSVEHQWLTPPEVEALRSSLERIPTSLFLNQLNVHERLTRLVSSHTQFGETGTTNIIENFIRDTLQRNQPLGPLVSQLEVERQQLESTLHDWSERLFNSMRRSEGSLLPPATVEILALGTRETCRQITQRILHAWEARIALRTTALTFDMMVLDFPPLPAALPAVTQLVVRGSTQALPAQFLEHMPNLVTLTIDGLITQLPAALGQLHALRRLDLSGTRLAPAALAPLASLTRLEHLLLNNISLPAFSWSANNMRHVTASPALQSLSIHGSNARFDPGVFAVLGSRSSLHTLLLGANQLSLDEQDVQALANLTQLRRLDLSNNPLVRTPDVSRMQALEELDLADSQISQWPTGLEQLQNLQHIDLRNLQITELPVGAGNLPGLHLSHHHLTPDAYSRFIQERAIAGTETFSDSDMETDDRSEDFDSETDDRPEDSPAHWAPSVNWQGRALALLDGMSEQDRQRASQLVSLNQSRVEFIELLIRMSRSAQARMPGARMLERIQTVIRGAFCTDLRRVLFEIGDEAVACVDRDALVFSQIEDVVEAHNSLSKADDESGTAVLIAMGTSHWRAQYLKMYVTSNINAWQNQGHPIEYSEIELYFRLALATRLGLRNQPGTQVYTSYTTWITPGMIDTAEAAILDNQAALLPHYLHSQQYWQHYLDSTQSMRIEAINHWRARIGEYLDAMGSEADVPPTLSDFESHRLHQVLVDIGYLGPLETLSGDRRLNDAQVRAAYEALGRMVDQARLELTEAVLQSQARMDAEPQPGPSRRN
ncbi:hypothetical protein EXN22_11025 [Pseudomonas tructae]|uniref:RING-type E3 ubiquitin transferase n=1 Tax=Pseudomonas tructae TaxID=2518644 RepID=A0A411MHC1_9PSED|nr:NEL-type E3 ubiquitin ligase domain-containing protein [Pseudomonas tructae]QBF26201.1 hypothetical protein EXN22_11025 [Pseudomonas tructae]